MRGLKKSVSIILTMVMIVSMFSLIPFTANATTFTDTLTYSLIGVSGSSYTNWTGKTSQSSAVYAGNSLGGNSSVQLRATSPSGIVSTTSGGKVKKISVTWNTNTLAGRTIDIYGKNSAYSSAGDLYGTSVNSSTSLGSIEYGTSTELNVEGDYEFIGIRSNSGALYLDEINIEWDDSSSDPPPQPQTYTVTWNNWNNSNLETDTDVEENSPPVYNGSTPIRPDADNNTYTFSGWNDGTTSYGLSDALPNVTKDVTYTAEFTSTPIVPANVDILTAADFPATGTTYEGFTDVKKSSGNNINSNAVYAGNSAKDTTNNSSNIQLRSNNNNSGIVSTTSGGTVKSVTINVGRGSGVVNVYGSNTAYESAADLYGNKAGTKVGTVTSTGTITFTTDYSYVGIRSNSGAIYLSSIEIEWDDGSSTTQTYTVTWQNYDGTELEIDTGVEENAAPKYDSATPVRSDADNNTYTFSGWYDGTTSYSLSDTLPNVTKDVTYTAEFTATPIPTQPTTAEETTEPPTEPPTQAPTEAPTTTPSVSGTSDTLTYSKIGITGSGYEGWSGKTDKTTAVYAGKTSGDGGAIQLRVTNNDTGIITTASGGKVKKITVTWNSSTAAGRTLNIYGKNSAYSSAADLFNSNNQGKLLGTIVKGTSTELIVDGDYTFIGMRSNGSSLKLDEIIITWDNGSSSNTYTVSWKNYDGTPLGSKSYAENEVPVYEGETPTKQSDANYDYTFSGWKDDDDNEYGKDDALLGVTKDVTYTALFDSTAITPVSTSYRVLKTDDAKLYNLDGKYYRYGNKLDQFSGTGSFDDTDIIFTPSGNLQLCEVDVADLAADTSTKIFLHTVYVTGTGTQQDPFIFYPNYKYGNPNSSVKDNNVVISSCHLGDAFFPQARIQVEDHSTSKFLPDTEEVYGSSTNQRYLGVGSNGYGNSYSGQQVSESGNGIVYHEWTDDSNKILYYLGKDGDVNLFSESITYSTDFGDGTAVTSYKVTWLNEDDTELGFDYYLFGDTPSYSGTPTKASDGTYNYVFDRWTPDITVVTGEATYKATYTSVPIVKHTVTWTNWNDSVLLKEQVEQGTLPSYSGDEPTRPATDYYTYTFSGWEPTVSAVTGDITYKAQFTETAIPYYTITWRDWNDRVLQTDSCKEGSTPTYNKGTPTRYADDEYSYLFLEWSPEVTPATADKTYVATYYATPLVDPNPNLVGHSGIVHTNDGKHYDLSNGSYFKDANGDRHQFTANDTAVTFSEDGNSIKLNGVVVATVSEVEHNKEYAHTVYITGDGSYADPYVVTPNYLYGNIYTDNINSDAAPKPAMADINPGDAFRGNCRINVGTTPVTFTKDPETAVAKTGYNPDYIYIGVGKHNYGYDYVDTNAVAYDGHGPYEFDNGKYTLYYIGEDSNDDYNKIYTFSLEPVADHPDFNGQYTVTWIDWNGTQLYQHEYDKGDTPVYNGVTPSREPDSEYVYEYNAADGWSPSIMPVTRDITYIAKYKKTPVNPPSPIADIAQIFPTNDLVEYNLVDKTQTNPDHLYYKYGDTVSQLPEKGEFREIGNKITLGGVEVADIVTYNSKEITSKFAHTVYAEGSGSEDDPLIFHANYIYSSGYKRISDGASLAIEDFASTTLRSYPGDRYKGTSRVSVGNTKVKFLGNNDDSFYSGYHASQHHYIGIGKTTYGYTYSFDVAEPYTFKDSNATLYFYGYSTDQYGSGYIFSEEPPVYQQAFYFLTKAKEVDIFEDGNINYYTSSETGKYYKYDKGEESGGAYPNARFVSIRYEDTIITKLIDEKLTPDSLGDVIFGYNSGLAEQYFGGRLLGFNTKLANEEVVMDEDNHTGSLRFMTVLSSEILKRLNSDSSYDYGYVFAATSKNATVSSFDNITVATAGKQSCKNTYNSLSGAYGSTDYDSTYYKYITAGVNDIPNNVKLIVRFYITYKGETHYIEYPANDPATTGIAFNSSDYIK